MVTDLIKATPEADIMRRDIFDRPPIFKWTGESPLLNALVAAVGELACSWKLAEACCRLQPEADCPGLSCSAELLNAQAYTTGGSDAA